MTINADVLVDLPVSDEEASQIAGEFRAIGVVPDVRVAAPRRSIEAIVIAVLVSLPMQALVTQLTNDFADDAYSRLKALVTKVLHRKQPAETAGTAKQVMVLQDTETGVRIVIEPDLPAESFQQLLSLDLTKVAHGPVHYDLGRKRWRSELDEQG